MKNNKGFTLIEVIVAVAILVMIATIATMSFSNYRKKADAKEKIILRETLIAEFNNYRVDNGYSANKNVLILSSNNTGIGLNLASNVSYGSNKCNDTTGSTIKYVKKGSIDGSSSLEEVFCIRFVCNDKLVIDDYSTNSTYCK